MLFQTVPQKIHHLKHLSSGSPTVPTNWFPHLKESTLVKRCTQTKFITLTHQNHPNGVVGKTLSMFNWVFFLGCSQSLIPMELLRMVSKTKCQLFRRATKTHPCKEACRVLVKPFVSYDSCLVSWPFSPNAQAIIHKTPQYTIVMLQLLQQAIL